MFGSIETKARPLRLAFLIDPENGRSIREAMQINSTLWGGSYNPIIPMYKRMPKTWRDKPFKAPKAEEVIKGYLDAFDPDILVQCSTQPLPQYVTNIGLDVIKPSEIWRHLRESSDGLGPRYGIGIFELLNFIFDEHFRYKSRFPVTIAIPKIPRTLSLFWASFLGEIPNFMLDIIEQNYAEALDISKTVADASHVKEFVKKDVLFPRRITGYSLRRFRRSGFHRDGNLFFMDGRNSADIIDYWNLRALGHQVLPIPKQFISDENWREEVIKFIRHFRIPWKHDPQVYDYATFIRSRNTTMEEMEAYAKSLEIRKEEDGGPDQPYYVSRHWYPRIWDEWARDKDGSEPDDFFEKEETIELNEVGGKVRFKAVRPEFAFESTGFSEPQYANEINFRFYGSTEMYAQVLPKGNGKNVIRAIAGLSSMHGGWRVGRNGLIRLVKYNWGEQREIPAAQDVFFAWMKDSGWEVKISTPGLIAKQIYAQLDGFVGHLGHEGLLKLLEHMNRGPDYERELPVGEVKNKLKIIDPRRDLHALLVSKKVFRIGAKIQCPYCMRHSWYSLDNINESLTCSKCLNIFPAIGNLGENLWCYKTSGPFSIPGYAEGGYCVLFTINFFNNELNHVKTTPALSFTAVNPAGNTLEADFGMLWQESTVKGFAEGVIFGECKTFGQFKKQDFKRMRGIAKIFPGAVLVFCTLRKELDPKEVRELIKITNAGRKYWKSEKPINPVLILTGNELLSEFGFRENWRERGFTQFDRIYNLLEMCDATQQIYLGLSSWQTVWQQNWENRRKKRQQSRNLAGNQSNTND